MPVRGIFPNTLDSNFGAPRGGGTRSHDGLDIMAPEGREILACVNGTVESMRWNELGGNTIWLRGDDGLLYYFAHLSRYNEALRQGSKVLAGDLLGYVGSTGNATTPHLHFEIHQSKSSPGLDPYGILRRDGVLVMPMPLDSIAKATKPTSTKRRR